MNLLSIKNLAFSVSIYLTSLLCAAATTEQWQLTTLHSFGNPERNAHQPLSGVILGSDGFLYGTCLAGGFGGGGTLFRVRTDGKDQQILHYFTNSPSNASSAFAGVVEAKDGRLYGGTTGGAGDSVIYGVNRDGSNFQVLHNFARSIDGFGVDSELIEASDGMLYGTTRAGGSNELGTVFRLNKDGSNYETLHHFAVHEAVAPYAPLLEGSDGVLYGIGDSINLDDLGTISAKIFKINKDGSGYETLHDFGLGQDDMAPRNYWGLTEGSNGKLFGTTYIPYWTELTNGFNVIFSVGKDGQNFSVLRDMRELLVLTPLHKGVDGKFYGGTVNGGKHNCGLLFSISEDGSRFAVEKNFGANSHDITAPVGALAQDSSGMFFGTSLDFAPMREAVFSVQEAKTRLLWIFDASGGDSYQPSTGVAINTNGTLFGATSRGGSHDSGVAFRLNADGSDYKVITDLPKFERKSLPTSITVDEDTNVFLRSSLYGKRKDSIVLRISATGKKNIVTQLRQLARLDAQDGGDGYLYGTTSQGKFRLGGIYRIDKAGTHYQSLHDFSASEGSNPSLVVSTDGYLYGACSDDGAEGGGSVFRMNRDGTGFVILRSFANVNVYSGYVDPSYFTNAPHPVLLFESGTVLYGLSSGRGYFRIDKDGGNVSRPKDFGFVYFGSPNLFLGNDGLVYGTVSGDVFRMNPDSSGYTVLYSGLYSSRLVQGVDNDLYGTTPNGGALNCGMVFKLGP